MKVGDLVAYAEEEAVRARTLPAETSQQGIIIDGPWDGYAGNNATRRYEIVWYTCGNKGWWEEKYLEIISEAR